MFDGVIFVIALWIGEVFQSIIQLLLPVVDYYYSVVIDSCELLLRCELSVQELQCISAYCEMLLSIYFGLIICFNKILNNLFF